MFRTLDIILLNSNRREMVANYCIQAAFVTIYMAFHMAARFGWSPARRTAPYQILTAVQGKGDLGMESKQERVLTLPFISESTRPFLDATLLFSIAVHIATLFSFIRGHALNIPIPTTAGVSSAFISVYTIFPPLVLHSCAADHLRRKHGRRYIWSALGAISLTMAGLYFSDPGGAWRRDWRNWNDFKLQNLKDKELMDLLYKDPDHQLKWESFCVTKLGADRANWAFTIILGIVFVIAVFTLVFLGNAFRIPFLRGERCSPLRKVRQYKWVISAFLALQAMWVCLGIFFWFRYELNKYTGDLNKDQEWTFGQVLAVATWAPVLMEVYVLWRDGAEKGLTGLLSDRFVVVDVAQVESVAGKQNRLEGSQSSDVEDQTQNQAEHLETSSTDEQRTSSRERSRSLDLSNTRENGPDRAQTAPQ